MIFKEIIDVLLSIIIVLFMLPLFLIVSILIILDSKGPVLFVQQRVGKNLKIFKIYKFRTMHVYNRAGSSFRTEKNDSRITKVGKILRKLSIDELPQLINVLKGEMSLIGPRPEVPEQENDYIDKVKYFFRHKFKPGISGYAQVKFRSNANFHQRLAADIFYINNLSFYLDLKILIATFSVVFLRKGVV